MPRFTVMLDKIHSLIFSVVNHCKASPQEYSQCWDDLRACFERMFAGAKELIESQSSYFLTGDSAFPLSEVSTGIHGGF